MTGAKLIVEKNIRTDINSRGYALGPGFMDAMHNYVIDILDRAVHRAEKSKRVRVLPEDIGV